MASKAGSMRIRRQRLLIYKTEGVSLFLSALVVLSIGMVGLEMTNLASKDATVSVSDLNSEEAKSLTTGGLEAALLELEKGQNPAKTYSLPMNGASSFENSVAITSNPAARTITVSGIAENGRNDAKKIYTISAEFSADDIQLHTEHAAFSGDLLQGLYIEKTGTRRNILDQIRVSWNQSYCARLVTCPNPEQAEPPEVPAATGCWNSPADWTPYEDPSNHNKILICHAAAEHRNTISVNKNVVEAHFCHHDDTLGPCNAEIQEPVYVTCDKEDLSAEQIESLDQYCSVTSGGNKINRIIMNGSTTVFQSGSIPSGSTMATSGEAIDIVNVTMDTAGNYTIDSIRFHSAIRDGTWFTVELLFLDGSSVAETFQVHTYDIDSSLLEAEQNDVHHGTDFTTVDGSGSKTGEVTIFASNNYVFTAKVLGSQMTCGQNGPAAHVSARVRVNDIFYDAFGGGDVQPGDLYTKDNLMVENDYAIEATASMPPCNNYFKTVLSTDTTLVKLLTDGNTPPATLSGFGGQQAVSAILSAYIADGVINLPSNQVIVLFELGNDADSSNSDFQDLVLLITITKQ